MDMKKPRKIARGKQGGAGRSAQRKPARKVRGRKIRQGGWDGNESVSKVSNGGGRGI